MSVRLVVTGTDTDVGKTVFAAGLAGMMGARYWKPIQAGLEGGSDADRVVRLGGLSPDSILPEAYRLETPCSPHAAATIDGITIADERLAVPAVPGPLVIEGAGGVLVPIREDLLFADLFARWRLPVVLVARTALGTINHSLLSLEALAARGVPVLGIAFIGDAVPETERVIPVISGVRRLGRLPQLDPLNAATLAAAMATSFRAGEFA